MKNKVEDLGRAWKDFKQVNEERLSEIEKKGSADIILNERLNKLNEVVDSMSSRMQDLELKEDRPEYNRRTNLNLSKKHLENYLRKGIINYPNSGENLLLKKSVGTTTADSASFEDSNTSFWDSYITGEKQSKKSIMRSLCKNVRISTDTFKYIYTADPFTVFWNGNQSNSEGIAVNSRVKNIKSFPLYSIVVVNGDMIRDEYFDIAEWFSDRVQESFVAKEDQAFIAGSGTQSAVNPGFDFPVGFLQNPDLAFIKAEVSSSSSKTYADEIIDLYYKLPPKYLEQAKFLAHPNFLKLLRSLKDSSGRYIVDFNSESGLETLLGLEVKLTGYMQDATSGNIPIVLADFASFYLLVESRGLSIMRDPYTKKPDYTFMAHKKIGGDIFDIKAAIGLVMS